MCRLFGCIASSPISALWPAVEAPQSLLVQSQIDRKRLQRDGWGIGWYSERHPRVIKSPRPAYQDKPRFVKAAEQARGQVVLSHVRWASNPLKLARHELIGTAHTQPFTHQGWMFVHNGTLYIPREVRAALGPLGRFIKGKNDSEVLFYWILQHLKKPLENRATRPQIVRALRTSIAGLHRIWRGCKNRYPIYKQPYHGLNWLLTNGESMLAFCYADPRGWSRAKALCDPRQPYFELQVQHHADQIMVASEPLTPGLGWKALGHGRLLLARLQGQTLTAATVKVM